MNAFDPITLSCFKSYDVRGKLGQNLDETVAYRIGRAFAAWTQGRADDNAKRAVVLGHDNRPSSNALKRAAADGITDGGLDVLDIGLSGTEEVYFATSHYRAQGGIQITASHNPIEYNGLKFVAAQSRPLGSECLASVRRLAEQGQFAPQKKGAIRPCPDKSAYVDRLLNCIDPKALLPLRLVINCGNGVAGPVIDLLEQKLADLGVQTRFIKIHHTPDGAFPNGIPNPMIAKNRAATTAAIVENGADLGIAFDGDFDRCFFFDEKGRFVEGAYMVGAMAQAFLEKYKNAAIVYDPRVVLSTERVLQTHGGQGILSRSGHSFIKQSVRASGAVYGGEMSAHHYFRDFYYCDSGMIPWLLLWELLSKNRRRLCDWIDAMARDFPISGEINFRLQGADAQDLLQKAAQNLDAFDDKAGAIDTLDGLSVDFGDWRFNLRASGTEALVRLNAESRGDRALLDKKTQALQAWIEAQGGVLSDG